MGRLLEFKTYTSTNGIITDVDVKSGLVKGYFSIFDVKDSDGDVVMKGAFKKSLQENYNRIKHLYQHDPMKPLSGTKKGNLKVYEDEKGLAFESKIADTSFGKDTIILYQEGVIDEHSTGTYTIKSSAKNGYREITESMLFEGSTVTWGANQWAKGDMKSMLKDNLLSKADKVSKLLANGTFENEDMFDALDYYLKQLHTALQLKDETTQPIEPITEPNTKEMELKLALQLLNLKSIN